VSPIMRRILEVERMIEQAIAADPCARPAHELPDAECVEQWHRLCRRPVVGDRLPPEPASDYERDQFLAIWRELRQ
jgi:hypothetical protein